MTMKFPQTMQGVTMIEVLIPMVIVAIGLLGTASMVINGLENNRSAYLRTQASILAYDMADRIRVNGENADSYSGFSTASFTGTALPACYGDANGCNAANVVAADKFQWVQAIKGANGNVSMLPDATGTVQKNGDDFLVTVTWKETQWDEDEGKVADQDQTFVLEFNL